MKRLVLSVLLLLLTLGCATQPIPYTPDADFAPDRRPFVDQPRQTTEQEPPEQKRQAKWSNLRGHVLSDTSMHELGQLAAIPLIVVGESDIQFFGFGLAPEERKQFDEARAQRIDARVQRAMDAPILQDPKDRLACVLMLPVCPLTLAMVAGFRQVGVGAPAIERLSATNQEPSFISEGDGSRLATVLRQRFTSAALEQRTRRLAGDGYRPVADEAAAAPRLVVRFTEVTLHYQGRHRTLWVTAQAQALPGTSNDWPPTRHTYASAARPLSSWTADSDALVLEEIESALDALAGNIWAAYGPGKPSSPAMTR